MQPAGDRVGRKGAVSGDAAAPAVLAGTGMAPVAAGAAKATSGLLWAYSVRVSPLIRNLARTEQKITKTVRKAMGFIHLSIFLISCLFSCPYCGYMDGKVFVHTDGIPVTVPKDFPTFKL